MATVAIDSILGEWMKFVISPQVFVISSPLANSTDWLQLQFKHSTRHLRRLSSDFTKSSVDYLLWWALFSVHSVEQGVSRNNPKTSLLLQHKDQYKSQEQDAVLEEETNMEAVSPIISDIEYN